MIFETRVIDEETFLNFERLPDGSVVGKLIRIIPPHHPAPHMQEASGTYIEYRTQPTTSMATAELFVHSILEELDEDKGNEDKSRINDKSQ
ncbi:hypothetical protein [Paenibacillus sp. J2TS4]|uniref:hypothetical protein n=1 Tax=Paenibacillus sp. J2TS4 TaxID=2807194 RepID=UPI001B1222AC|nr:hypothetical protein [Paenibacillus sp. J2TS4]GIP31315.1 hypothetical protein J2TS4_05250 [Paenibacillus sp. J2TS4]